MNKSPDPSSRLVNTLIRWLCAAVLLLAPPASAQSYTTIKLSGMNLCVDIGYVSLDDGAQAIIWNCTGDPTQQWMPTTSMGSSYSLKVQHSGKCMDISEESMDNNASVVQWSCSGDANQTFHLVAQNGGYAIRALHSGKGVTPPSDTPQAGQALVQQTCTGTAAQTWDLSIVTTSVLPSKWSAVMPLTLIPVAAANLPDGNILVWSAYERFAFGGDSDKTYTSIFNPANGTSTETLVGNTQHDMFSPGIANLPDGRITMLGCLRRPATGYSMPARASR